MKKNVKIDLFEKKTGGYLCSTNRYKTNKQAIESYILLHPSMLNNLLAKKDIIL
jgi:hypothetical protein